MAVQAGRVRQSWLHDLQSTVYEMDALGYVQRPDVHFLMEDALEEVIVQAEGDMNIGHDDRVALSIRATDQAGQQIIIRIPFQSFGNMEVDNILNQIANALNSYQELTRDIGVVVTVAPRQQLGQVAGEGFVAYGNLTVLVKHKRCVVEINPRADDENESKHCFEQWIVLGLAYLVHHGLLTELPELRIVASTYKMLVKSRHRFRNRKKLVELLKTKFDLSAPSEVLLREVERAFGVHLVLYSVFSEVLVQFPPQYALPYMDAKPVIAGLLYGRHMQHWKHVDFVTQPAGLSNRTNHRSMRTCQLCFSIYERKQGCTRTGCAEDREVNCGFCHCCVNTCGACRTSVCGALQQGKGQEEQPELECVKFRESHRCVHCRSILFSPKCLELHQLICQALFAARCDQCGFKQHRGLQCGEIRCFVCGDVMRQGDLQDHRCFLKVEKLKTPSTRIAVYDFECALDAEKVHRPYLCTLWFPYGTPEELLDKYPHQPLEGEVEPVFVFWGVGSQEECSGVYTFFNCVMEPELKDYVFFAHNARSYDAILVKYYMSKYKREFSRDIQRGQKLLSMYFTRLDIEFRDSLCFIPTSLRSMSADFGIEELKKGYFPHRRVTLAYLESAAETEFLVERPDRTYFEMDVRAGEGGRKELAEMEQFLQQFYADPEARWDLKADAIAYCISDTVLLGKTLVQFREKLMEMADSMARPAHITKQTFDPLAYVTLPSAMMGLFMAQFLPLRTIGVIDRAEVYMHRRGEAYLQWIEHVGKAPLRRLSKTVGLRNGTEIYAYRDCYMEGCSQCFGESQRNERLNCSFAQCRFLADQRLHVLSATSAGVVQMWDHEFEKVRGTEEFAAWYTADNVEEKLPMDPRDSYKGGKVEAYKLCYPGDIQMCDFVSDYPGFCLGETFNPFDLQEVSLLSWPMPTGHPVQIYRPGPDVNVLDDSKLGVIKCRMLAPRGLYVPFLGYRVPSRLHGNSEELIYGLCRLCMRRRSFPCDHSDEERAFVGTWTLTEVQYAVHLGYVVQEIVDVWIYPTSDKYMFRSFIAPFVMEKIKSKRAGLVTEENTFTPKGLDIQAYVRELMEVDLQPSDFENSPAKRFTAKIAMNSVTGKFGQLEEQVSSRTFNETEYRESHQLMTDPGKDILFAQVLDEAGDIVVIEFKSKRWTMRGARRKNDIIVAHITAYGRWILHVLEFLLGDNLLYVDTDSAFHKLLEEGKRPYREGYRVGDLELELRLASKFVSCGRKWYSYEKPNGEAICKLKGFSLKQSNQVHFRSDSLYEHLVDCKMAVDEARTPNPLHIQLMQFRTERENLVTPFKRTVAQRKEARFQAMAAKRHILFPPNMNKNQMTLIDTLPYGF